MKSKVGDGMVADFETLEIFLDFIATRVNQIREGKVTAQTMSEELGQNKAYINKIENKRSKPSIDGIYYILDYLNTPVSVFFDKDVEMPSELVELIELSKKLTPEEMKLIIDMCKHLNKNKA